jgi:hypothetical protein
MDVRGKHLFGISLDPERLFVVGCEQAFGRWRCRLVIRVTVPLERSEHGRKELR